MITPEQAAGSLLDHLSTDAIGEIWRTSDHVCPGAFASLSLWLPSGASETSQHQTAN
jgi:hypothetical protein